MPKPSCPPKGHLRLALICVLALWANQAEASPLFDLTGDMQGNGGLQARTIPGGAAAAYFNPALLDDVPGSMQFGVMLLRQEIGIAVDNRPGPQYDIPEGISSAFHSDFNRLDRYAIPTRMLELGRPGDMRTKPFLARPRQHAGTGQETYAYMGFGLVVKAFKDHLTLGIHGMVPFGEFTTIHAFYSDEREQYFSNSLHPELYGARLTAPSLAFAAGVRLIKGLSLGVGATLSLKAAAVAPTYVTDTGNYETILIDMDTGVNVSLTPHFGISYRFLDERFRVTATAHPPRQMEFGTSFTFLLASGTEQSAGVPFVLNYTPWMIGGGAAFDILHGPDDALTVSGTLLYSAWSTYVDRHGDRPTPNFKWLDVISPVLGMRYRQGKVSMLADVAYTPSPIPEQAGRSNYVDNDRVSGALGSELGFQLFEVDMQIGLNLQAHHLLEQHHTKLRTPTDASGANLAPELVKDEVPDDAEISGDPVVGREGLQTNNPGFPGFGSEGWIFAGSLYLRVMI